MQTAALAARDGRTGNRRRPPRCGGLAAGMHRGRLTAASMSAVQPNLFLASMRLSGSPTVSSSWRHCGCATAVFGETGTPLGCNHHNQHARHGTRQPDKRVKRCVWGGIAPRNSCWCKSSPSQEYRSVAASSGRCQGPPRARPARETGLPRPDLCRLHGGAAWVRRGTAGDSGEKKRQRSKRGKSGRVKKTKGGDCANAGWCCGAKVDARARARGLTASRGGP